MSSRRRGAANVAGALISSGSSSDVVEKKKKWTHLPWSTWLSLLEEYKKDHSGSVLVPKEYKTPAGHKLGSWVDVQRKFMSRKKRGLSSTLTPDRIRQLEAVGFKWKVPRGGATIMWNDWLDMLKRFKSENNGSVRVPQHYETPEGFKLGSWVKRQRTLMRKKREGLEYNAAYFTQDRIDQLEALGFEWVVPGASTGAPTFSWNDSFEMLRDFKKSHSGSVCVPQLYETPGGYKLGKWVNQQRTYWSRKIRGLSCDRLNQDRIDQLEAIGFKWVVPRGPRAITTATTRTPPATASTRRNKKRKASPTAAASSAKKAKGAASDDIDDNLGVDIFEDGDPSMATVAEARKDDATEESLPEDSSQHDEDGDLWMDTKMPAAAAAKGSKEDAKSGGESLSDGEAECESGSSESHQLAARRKSPPPAAETTAKQDESQDETTGDSSEQLPPELENMAMVQQMVLLHAHDPLLANPDAAKHETFAAI